MDSFALRMRRVSLGKIAAVLLLAIGNTSVWSAEFAEDFAINPFAPDDYRVVRLSTDSPGVAASGTSIDISVTASEEDQAAVRLISYDSEQRRVESRFRFLASSSFPTEGAARVLIVAEWFNTLRDGGIGTPGLGELYVVLDVRSQHDGINYVNICAWFLDEQRVQQPAITDQDNTPDGCMHSGWSFDSFYEHQAYLDFDPVSREIIFGFDGIERRETLLSGIELFDARSYNRRVDYGVSGRTNTASIQVVSLDEHYDMRWVFAEGRFTTVPASFTDDLRRDMRWTDELVKLASHGASSESTVDTPLRLADNPDYIEADIELLSISSLAGDNASVDATINGIVYNDLQDGGTENGIGNVQATLALRTAENRQTPHMVYCLFRSDDENGGRTSLLDPTSDALCATHSSEFAFDTFYRFLLHLDREQRRITFQIDEVSIDVDIAGDIFTAAENSMAISAIARQDSSAHVRIDNIRTDPNLSFGEMPISDEAAQIEPAEQPVDMDNSMNGAQNDTSESEGQSEFDSVGYSNGGGCSVSDSRATNVILLLLTITFWIFRQRRHRCVISLR